MQQQHRSTRKRTLRRGILSMELVLTLPVLMLLLLGIFEFTCLFFTYGSVVEASRAGARVATLQGVLEDDIYGAVHRSLGSRLFQAAEVVYDPAEDSGEEVACGIRLPMTVCAPNLLWPVGFDLDGQYIECATRMAKE